MSCPTATAPINIESTQQGCKLKCKYSIGYPEYKWAAARDASSLSFTPTENASTPCATYNDVDYVLKSVRIYAPSIHTWSGQKAPAELVVLHDSVQGGKQLAVCVPLSDSVMASPDLNGLVSAGLGVPQGQAPTAISMDNLSLETCIPKERFLAYGAVAPFFGCATTQIVVFPLAASVGISTQVRSQLTQGLVDSRLPLRKAPPGYSMSSSPPSIRGASSLGGSIYIDCSPTESVGETLVPVSTAGEDLRNWLTGHAHSRLALVSVGAAVMIIGWYAAQKLLPRPKTETA